MKTWTISVADQVFGVKEDLRTETRSTSAWGKAMLKSLTKKYRWKGLTKRMI